MNIVLRLDPLRLALFAATCLFAAPAPALAAGPPLRVLLLSGQNNHDWRTTTPKLRAILTGSGRFTVDVTEHPEHTTAETLARYDVIVSDWNAWGDAQVKEWRPATRTAFLEFIRSGKGYVSIHAGSSSFYDWPEYQQIGGLFWNLGPTSHGPPHEFPVEFVGDHPITRGLAPFRTTDELWLKPGMHPAAQLVATGDGQPLAVTTALGRGRGFALLLGHSAEYMNTPGFQSLLLRGTEWAATGEVTLRGTSDTRGFDADTVIRRVAAYRFGDDREALLALEQLLQAAAADDTLRSTLAAKLAGALAADASTEGKRAFLDGLSLLGTAAEVPALAKALTDSELLHHACQALARIPAPEAEAALTTALGTTTGSARATVLQALASRGAASAVPAIAGFVADADTDVAAAALDALGTLGGPEATAALQTAESRIAPALRERWATALLRCAGSLRDEGRTNEAATLFAALARPGRPASVREAAFPAYVGLAADAAVADVLAALAGPDPVLRRAALRALWSNRHPALLKAAADGLDVLSPEQQEGVLLLCGERGDASLLPRRHPRGRQPAARSPTGRGQDPRLGRQRQRRRYPGAPRRDGLRRGPESRRGSPGTAAWPGGRCGDSGRARSRPASPATNPRPRDRRAGRPGGHTRFALGLAQPGPRRADRGAADPGPPRGHVRLRSPCAAPQPGHAGRSGTARRRVGGDRSSRHRHRTDPRASVERRAAAHGGQSRGRAGCAGWFARVRRGAPATPVRPTGSPAGRGACVGRLARRRTAR
ncbi:MAG: ThuA domain-containing protein [Verrucomicrobia bacterium]|nr:ThuA domain-containing protein [Verrucomicrobiota bacterium]